MSYGEAPQQCFSKSHHTLISELVVGESGAATTGLIIAKADPRYYPSKREDGEERGQLSFLLRDTSAFVNVTCWGTAGYAKELAARLQVKDVIEIVNPKIETKPDTEAERSWSPSTPVPFRLQVDQKSSQINAYDKVEQFTEILHRPVKGEGDYISLLNINNLHTMYDGKSVNVLAVVKTVPAIREVKDKQCCNLELIDNTMQSMRLTVWTQSIIDLSLNWLPKMNVLFLADVKVKYNTFINAASLTCFSKTVVTVNPDTKAAHALFNFAQTLTEEALTAQTASSCTTPRKPIGEIKNSVTVEELQDEQMSSGVLCAILTTLPFDKGVSSKCCGCNKKVYGLCPKTECFGRDINPFYDFTVTFSDHTGTIERVKLRGDVAESVIGVPVSVFQEWNQQDKDSCHNRLLLDRFRVVFSSFVAQSGDLWLSVLQIEPWDTSMAGS